MRSSIASHLVRTRPPAGEPGAVDRTTDTAAFLEDAAHVPGGFAAEVAFPRTERDIADIVRTARAVLPVGAQSSLTGGATPRGEVVLSTARMRTLEVDGAARVRAGAGVTLVEVGARLRAIGALYPPAPTFLGATVGGTVSTNAAGAATFKYGTTRTWVDGLTVVLVNGEVLDLARGECVAHTDGYFDVAYASGEVARVPVPRYRMPDVPKVSAGYFAAPRMDLVDLFIGSEGTLGVITAATLRSVSPAPAACLVFVTFADVDRALSFVAAVRAESQRTWKSDANSLDVSAIEHMDARSLALLREDGVDTRLGVSLGPAASLSACWSPRPFRPVHPRRTSTTLSVRPTTLMRRRRRRRSHGLCTCSRLLVRPTTCWWRHQGMWLESIGSSRCRRRCLSL
ncbi:MAG: FAD-binding oxidoreductase [Vicinamibacterales bacterium]